MIQRVDEKHNRSINGEKAGRTADGVPENAGGAVQNTAAAGISGGSGGMGAAAEKGGSGGMRAAAERGSSGGTGAAAERGGSGGTGAAAEKGGRENAGSDGARCCEIRRKTRETGIYLRLNLDGQGEAHIQSGVGYLNHMLEIFAKHSGMDLTLECRGDTWVDDHHSVEDIGICLGQALRESLGDKKGIQRYASLILPMDEALLACALDISGRGGYFEEMSLPSQKIGQFDSELVHEFMQALAQQAGITLHIRQLSGRNTHHIVEGAFKALARCLRAAVSVDERFKDSIPSSKGVL